MLLRRDSLETEKKSVSGGEIWNEVRSLEGFFPKWKRFDYDVSSTHIQAEGQVLGGQRPPLGFSVSYFTNELQQQS